MTTVYVPYIVDGPDGEPVELELAAEVSADGEVSGLRCIAAKSEKTTMPAELYREFHDLKGAIPEWALRQIDMGDLTEDAQRRLEARERGWR
jgi:hypothetical protein